MSKPRQFPVTLADVARQADVSIMTVSNVLAGRGGFTAATAATVRKVARTLGYRSNVAARAMARRRFGSFALLLGQTQMSSYLPPDLLAGIEDGLQARDEHLVVARLPDAKLTDPEYVPTILRHWMVDGLLINYHVNVPPRMVELIEETRLPAIWINVKRARDAVRPDDAGMAAGLTRQLIALGHRRIAYVDFNTPIGDTPMHYSSLDRREGYRMALTEAGAMPAFVGRPAGCEDYMTLVRDCLRHPARPTAVVTYDTFAATCFLHGATLLGLDVPRDLSVAGFDVHATKTMNWKLAVGGIPQQEIGRQAVRMLREKIATPNAHLPALALPGTFLAGSTVAAVPAAKLDPSPGAATMSTNQPTNQPNQPTNPTKGSTTMKTHQHHIVGLIALVATSGALAAELVWDPNGSAPGTGGAGDWNTTAMNWWDGTNFVAWHNTLNAGSTAVFGGTAGSVRQTTSITAGALRFDVAGYTLTADASGRTLDITSASGFGCLLSFDNRITRLTVAAGNTVTWSPTVVLGHRFYKSGPGTHVFAGYFSGNHNSHHALTVNGGVFRLGGNIPANMNCGFFRVVSGGTLDMDVHDLLGFRRLNVDSGGTLKGQAGAEAFFSNESSTLAGSIEGALTLRWSPPIAANALTISGDNPLFTGTVHADLRGIININHNGAVRNAVLDVARVTVHFRTATPSVAGLTNSANSASVDTIILGTTGTDCLLTLTGAGTYSFGRQIAQAAGQVGSIRKTGSGTQTFTRANSYSGGTAIENGTLAVSGLGSLGTGNVAVTAYGTLQLGSSAAIADTATLTLTDAGANTAAVVLGTGVNETVRRLVVNGDLSPAGTHGATGSGARHVNDVHFSGTGRLTVLEGPAGTVLLLR